MSALPTFCGALGRRAPNATTLMASGRNASEAMVVNPDCTVEYVVSLPESMYDKATGTHVLRCSNMRIQRIESLPRVERLFLDLNPQITANLSQDTNITHLIISFNNFTSLDGLEMPPRVDELDLSGNALTGISEGKLPANLTYLYLDKNNISSLDDFALPPGLRNLYLTNNRLASVPTVPERIRELYLDGNPIIQLEHSLPPSLRNFSCTRCEITSIRGVDFPSSLKTLKLDGNAITNFEIRASDVATFNQLDVFTGRFEQNRCQDPQAKLIMVRPNGQFLCVISDDRFREQYPSAIAGSIDIDFGAIEDVGKPSTPPKSSNSSQLKTLAALLAAVLVTAIIFIITRAYRRRNRNRRLRDQKMSTVVDSTLQMFGSTEQASHEYLSNDIRNDSRVIPYRVDQNEIQVLGLIAKGGFGAVYKAKFRGRIVAIKQLQREKTREPGAIGSFMDEIRMCATLDHPKVVEFIGVAWSNLLDVAVLTEFMPGGDLLSALRRHGEELAAARRGLDGEEKRGIHIVENERRCDIDEENVVGVDSMIEHDPQDWFEGSSSLPAKSLIALDVVEALVYLHSFSSPIIHRDLKARNVLLTADGVGKLSDFGISREVPLDETMTGEIGTVAWIAPEVLQGERYGEKADIYSFGVLLVELDTGRHPYGRDLQVGATLTDQGQRPRTPTTVTDEQLVHGCDVSALASATSINNARIAMLVSMGKLRPSLSLGCPLAIAELGARCLRHKPSDRPSAIEIHYVLRKIMLQMAPPEHHHGSVQR